jgi:zinc protease
VSKRSSSQRAELVARLNKQAKSPGAKLRFAGEFSFGQGPGSVGRYVLGNGLSVLVMSDSSAPVLSYHTWYRVGSKHETRGKTGLAHLFEHLMFNETKQLRKGTLDRMIEAAGGETNAATWTDWTHYHSELPASELAMIAKIEADRMQHLVLRRAQVVSEKEVVANERRYRVDDDLEGEVSELLYTTAFTRHPYGWPTIGFMRDIEGFTLADCRRFYGTYYAPNNATLVIVGDVTEEAALSVVQAEYGVMRRAQVPSLRAPKEPAQKRERSCLLQRPTPAPKLAIGYRAPSFRDADYVVLALANDILLGGRSSRLFELLLRDQELVTDLHGSIAPFADPGLYELWFSLRPGRDLSAVLSLLDRELARLRDTKVSARELAKVKNRAELGFLQGLETTSGKAEQLGFFETVAGDASGLFSRIEALRAVTPHDIQRVARRYLSAKQRTRISVVPAEASVAPEPEARA